ncbi:MAG: nucleotide exchange factor GrpE [Pseudomonadota bacterium]|nr:nucleotide exchange factor GrpE [Pseudomonadota bacterium]
MTDEMSTENSAAAEQGGGQEKEVIPSLEAQLRQAELNAEEHHDAWLRAKADAENARRRALDEIDKARKFALDKFAAELLPVKDSLEAALATGDSASIESLKSGVELTLKQLSGVFEKNSVKEINPLGDKFDPHYHQAIALVEAEGEANTVATVLQKGYALNERVMRPALVTVIKPN